MKLASRPYEKILGFVFIHYENSIDVQLKTFQGDKVVRNQNWIQVEKKPENVYDGSNSKSREY